ncbi:hypothetical protein AHAS_Ahas13G0489800 [Arachis hypogaea]
MPLATCPLRGLKFHSYPLNVASTPHLDDCHRNLLHLYYRSDKRTHHQRSFHGEPHASSTPFRWFSIFLLPDFGSCLLRTQGYSCTSL